MIQGHSKNPAGDEGDGFGAVFAEVFARLGHREALGADEAQHEVADGGKRAGAGSDALGEVSLGTDSASAASR